ncbi:MAG: outer membrane beta-barrel domain-containing protein [Steroidobacteraceae bacterium]|jgi:outer membrane beta-barrel protein
MDTRICILLLSSIALGCSGCAIFHRNAEQPAPNPETTPSAASPDSDNQSAPPSVIEPQVERREVKVPAIHPSNVELGAYYGEISIQDFGAQPVAGLRLDYHISEDFFAEITYGRAKGGLTSFESLSDVQLLTNAERRFTYYNLSLGYNLLPGEVFIGRNLAMTSAFYVIGGVGSVDFAGDQNFTVNFGAGFRVLPTDWLAVHIDVQDLVFRSDVTGVEELKNNLQATIGATVFF